VLTWRAYLAIGLVVLAAAGTAYVGFTWRSLERAAAEATERAEDAEGAATRNAAALAEAARTHNAQMAAVTERAAAAEAERQALATQMEAIRADPTHSAPVASVLDLAVDQLRLRRAASAGGPDGGDRAARAPARRARPAGAAGARRGTYAGPRRGAAAGI
jgi:hypothetical protein